MNSLKTMAIVISVVTALLLTIGMAKQIIPCVKEYCDMQNNLFGWIMDNGGQISPKIQYSTGPDPAWSIRGIFANDEINQGETILTLTPNLSMCSNNACSLVDTLTEELRKGNESYWAPYIAAMDEHNVDIPSVWTEEEISLLYGLYPFDWTRHTNWFYHECGGDISDPESMRAMLLVVARCHGMEGSICMSPLYDNLNHNNAFRNAIVSREGPLSIIRATRNIGVGEQIYLSYGQEGVGRFLRDYGFITPRPHKWEFMDSQQRMVSFLLVDGKNDILDIDINPDMNHYQTNLPEFLKEVIRQLEYLFNNEPVLTETMKQDRINMALTYRQEYIRALELLHTFLESQITGKGEL